MYHHHDARDVIRVWIIERISMNEIMSPSELEKLMGMEMPDRELLELLAQCVLDERVTPEQAERLVHAGYIAADKEHGEGYVTTRSGNDIIKWYLPDVAQRLYDRNKGALT